MKVHWTNNAVDHLLNIYEYIALNSPTYARQILDKNSAAQSKSTTSLILAARFPSIKPKISAS